MEILPASLWIVAFIFILLAVINIITRLIKTRRCTAVVSGVITDIKEKVRTRNGVTSREYVPTVAYTVAGLDYSLKYKKAYNANTYATGQAVEVMYNPNKPSEINTRGTSNKADVVFIIIGILIAFAGVVLMLLN
jgi:hypothetical protein